MWMLLLLLVACSGEPEKLVVGDVVPREVLIPVSELIEPGPTSLPGPLAQVTMFSTEAEARQTVEKLRETRVNMMEDKVGEVLVIGGPLKGYDAATFALHIQQDRVVAVDLQLSGIGLQKQLIDAWGTPATVTTNNGEVQRWVNTNGLQVDMMADDSDENLILKYTMHTDGPAKVTDQD
ncbi:MAG: hypothetical protein HN348_07550 [Proteobacteria bacterium]|jgi:hypothetical protein|nr:hypothetical protein [Pseudomonadota bacterium]